MKLVIFDVLAAFFVAVNVNEHKLLTCGRMEKTVGRLCNASARFEFYPVKSSQNV